MNRNLTYFMREAKEETVNYPAPSGFKDENGKPLDMEIKVLSAEKIKQIMNRYKKRGIAFDKSGKPYISGGEVVYKSENDTEKALRHIVAEALVYHNLKDKELMEFYKCYDITEMPLKVFSKNEEYSYVFDAVMTTLGIIRDDAEEAPDEMEEAKN